MLSVRKSMLFVGLLIMPALAAVGRAQEPATPAGEALAALEKKVDELLASPKEADQSWGAYLAGKHGIKAAVPALLKLTDKAAAPADWYKQPARFYAAAALVDLAPDLDEKALQLFIDEKCHALAMALIAAHPQGKEKLLFGIIDPARKPGPVSDEAWAAACNLLVQGRAAGFAAGLIRETSVHMKVVVREAGPLGFRDGGSRKATIRCGDGQIVFGDEFPPVVYHQLTLRERSGLTLLAPGPKNVYLERSESSKPGQMGIGSISGSFDRDGYRLSCLAALLRRRSEDLEARIESGATVEWKDADDLRQRVASAVRDVLGAWARLGESLTEQGLLTEEEQRAAAPTVVLEVRDLREDRKAPLPKVEDLSKGGPANPPKQDVF
jgi:hypothetical protein